MRKREKGTFEMETKSQEPVGNSFANDSSGQITPWIDISTGENVINNNALFDYRSVAINGVLPCRYVSVTTQNQVNVEDEGDSLDSKYHRPSR